MKELRLDCGAIAVAEVHAASEGKVGSNQVHAGGIVKDLRDTYGGTMLSKTRTVSVWQHPAACPSLASTETKKMPHSHHY